MNYYAYIPNIPEFSNHPDFTVLLQEDAYNALQELPPETEVVIRVFNDYNITVLRQNIVSLENAKDTVYLMRNLSEIATFDYTNSFNVQLSINGDHTFILNVYHNSSTYNSISKYLKYDKNLVPDKDGNVWLPDSITINKNFAKDYLKEQIRSRYGFFNRPNSGLSNIIVDSFFPRLLYANDCNILQATANANLPKTSVAISEFIANTLNIKKVPTEQLCRILGYTPKDLKQLLTKVKARKLTMIFAGAGGTGINTAYWLKEISEMTNTINIFHNIDIYDSDNIEFSNILRFPVDIREYTFNSTHKINLLNALVQRLSTTKVRAYRHMIHNSYDIGYQHIDHITNKLIPSTFIYGAPSIESRNTFSSLGNFICATHADTTCSMWLNPSQDVDLQVESYGMIQLGGFFMNQLRMAIKLLELLADETDLTQVDTSVLEYEFDGTLIGTTDRQYNFQIQRDLLMMTETEANNV